MLDRAVMERPKKEPLSLRVKIAEDQGPRPTMEDAHFMQKLDSGNVLTGVFDGHGGYQISEYANNRFPALFSFYLQENGGNVRKAFEDTMVEIDREIPEGGCYDRMGTTAVVSYIDQTTHLIYTATLGDSEANIYRKDAEGNLKSIPLSCVRDFGSKKDRQRLETAWGSDIVAACFERARGREGTKSVRSYLSHGVNVARAIGDRCVASRGDVQIISRKPKITVNQLMKGDVLVNACDGLKDYASEGTIVKTLSDQYDDLSKMGILDIFLSWVLWIFTLGCYGNTVSPAEKLVSLAKEEMGSEAGDNITISLIEVS